MGTLQQIPPPGTDLVLKAPVGHYPLPPEIKPGIKPPKQLTGPNELPIIITDPPTCPDDSKNCRIGSKPRRDAATQATVESYFGYASSGTQDY